MLPVHPQESAPGHLRPPDPLQLVDLPVSFNDNDQGQSVFGLCILDGQEFRGLSIGLFVKWTTHVMNTLRYVDLEHASEIGASSEYH